MNFYNFIKSYWSNDTDIGHKVNHCCEHVKAIEHVFYNKLGKVENKLEEIQICVDSLMKNYKYDVDDSLSSPRISNHSETSNVSSDGSNLGVYVKSRINDNTQLQYVTGKTNHYNTRKRLYENVEMEKVIDEKEPAPRKRIKKINDQLINNGCNVTRISDNSLIVECDCDKVRDIVKVN